MYNELLTAANLDFSTFNASEREFFTVQFKSPENDTDSEKYFLWVVGLTDSFKARVWVEGEDDSHFLDYTFSARELAAIQWKLVEYLHCLAYNGKAYAETEMSVPEGQEAWRRKAV
ncbi:MAG: hypothetical protein VB078_09070 [Clostridiaceae bacterium]|nr:hypothetical protein [Clostridiaceae bacterium]